MSFPISEGGEIPLSLQHQTHTASIMGTSSITRGIRNCNPGNIRRSGSNWLGMRERQEDGAFVQFCDMVFGIRALVILLRRYYVKYHLRTVRGIISRYAPEQENRTDVYMEYVAKSLGVAADERIPSLDFCHELFDRSTLFRLCHAICWMESRYELGEEEFGRALELCR